MNLGTLNSPKCGVNKSNNDDGLRISLSNKTGRRDLGPTLATFPQENGDLKVVQLFNKDSLTKHNHKYTFVLTSGCKKVKTLSYKLGNLLTVLDYERCQNQEGSLLHEEQIYLAANKLCETFFPKMVLKSETSDQSKASSRE